MNYSHLTALQNRHLPELCTTELCAIHVLFHWISSNLFPFQGSLSRWNRKKYGEFNQVCVVDVQFAPAPILPGTIFGVCVGKRCCASWTSTILTGSQSSSFLPIPSAPLFLQGKKFDDISDIQQHVTRLLNNIPKEDFKQIWQVMYCRAQ